MIREGVAEDLAGVSRVQAGVPEAAGWPVEEALAYQLDVAEVEGIIVGFLLTRRLVEGESEVLNLAVDSEHRRRGLAREMLERAKERWPGKWFLEVRESNVGAQKCYERLGFRAVGVRPGYYPSKNGKIAEGGIVMAMGW